MKGREGKGHEKREPARDKRLERVFQSAAKGHPEPYEAQRRMQKKTPPKGR